MAGAATPISVYRNVRLRVLWGLSSTSLVMVFVWLCFICPLIFVLLEVDSLRMQTHTREVDMLKRGYCGSIAGARCSHANDEASIRGEIGDKWPMVDHTIEVLLSAGMSTPGLREAAALGVDVSLAGFIQLAPACVVWLSWFAVTVGMYHSGVNHAQSWVEIFQSSTAWQVLPPILWGINWLYMERDARVFGTLVVLKIMTPVVVLGYAHQLFDLHAFNSVSSFVYCSSGGLASVAWRASQAASGHAWRSCLSCGDAK